MFSHVQIAFLGSLLAISQVFASPTPQIVKPRSPEAIIKCNTDFATLPQLEHCKTAIDKIVARTPKVCTGLYAPEYDVETYQSCTVQTFSKIGMAHCQDWVIVKDEALNILNNCALKGIDKLKTGGTAYFLDEKGQENGDGVRLILEPMVTILPMPTIVPGPYRTDIPQA